MIASLKAEFRKLFTVRSTYIIILLMLALTAFFGMYVQGMKADAGDLHNPNLLSHSVFLLISNVRIFGAIIAILTLTHEYRYNTIMYTLTASNSRTKTLIAKLITITVFGLILTAVIALFGLEMVRLGLHIKHFTPVAQELHYGNLIWRVLFFGWSTVVVGLLLAALLRNQVATIASLFLIPTAEQLLSLLFKANSVYLPFVSQGSVLMAPEPRLGTISVGHAALTFTAYLVVGLIAAFLLFWRRDAN